MEGLVGDAFPRKKVLKKEKEINDQFEDCERKEYEDHNVKIVAIYFSAYFCPSSRNFTWLLAEFYNEINLDEKQFEIIFASFDKGDDFSKAYAEMPWMAFKKGDPHVLALKNKYKIKSVPSLIVLDAETGRTISTRGRKDV